jgi:hypothetical protein
VPTGECTTAGQDHREDHSLGRLWSATSPGGRLEALVAAEKNTLCDGASKIEALCDAPGNG